MKTIEQSGICSVNLNGLHKVLHQGKHFNRSELPCDGRHNEFITNCFVFINSPLVGIDAAIRMAKSTAIISK